MAFIICWPSLRSLRDTIEPFLLLNSSNGLVRLFHDRMDFQIVDRHRISVVERVFYAKTDFEFVQFELGDSEKPDLVKPVFERVINFKTLFDLLTSPNAVSSSATKVLWKFTPNTLEMQKQNNIINPAVVNVWSSVPVAVHQGKSTFSEEMSFTGKKYFDFDAFTFKTGCKIQTKFSPDIQDDFMNLSVVSSIGKLKVQSNKMEITAEYKSRKNGMTIFYETAKLVKKKDDKQGKKVTPRFQIEMLDSENKFIETTFHLKPLRILHRLVGCSSRIEWYVSENKPLLFVFYQGVNPTERRIAYLSVGS
jgi:hypothetical protein